MPVTTNFSWTTPIEDASAGIWDTILNTLFDEIDDDLNDVKTVADAALPKAGGTLTGNVNFVTGTTKISAKGSASGAVTLDLATSDYFTVTKTGNLTFYFSNWPGSNRAEFIIVMVDNNGSTGAVTFSGVSWHDNVAPTIRGVGVQGFLFWSHNNGNTVYGKHIYENTTL